jgi:hypothetical protein
VKKGQFVTLDARLSAASVMGGEANLKRLI